MPARIKIDALGGEIVNGKIDSIGPIAIERARSATGALGGSEQEGVQDKVFEVKIRLDKLPRGILPGTTGEVSFLLEKTPDTVFVPLNSVFQKNGQSVVFKYKKGKYEKVAVKLGAKNKSYVIVVEPGLLPGEELFAVDLERKM